MIQIVKKNVKKKKHSVTLQNLKQKKKGTTDEGRGLSAREGSVCKKRCSEATDSSACLCLVVNT